MKAKQWTNTQTEFIGQITAMTGDYTRLGQWLNACCEEMGTTPAEVLSKLLKLDDIDEETADVRTANVGLRVDKMMTPEERETLIRSDTYENEPPELDLD